MIEQLVTTRTILVKTQLDVSDWNIKLATCDLVLSMNKDGKFKNSFSLTMLDQNKKKTTIRVCKTGAFILTGCKNEESALFCVTTLSTYLQSLNNQTFLIVPILTNLRYSLPFQISFTKALEFFKNKKFIVFIEECYLRLMIKIASTDVNLTSHKFTGNHSVASQVPYETYLTLMTDRERHKKTRKSRYCIFRIFRSGSVIMSGISPDHMEYYYNTVKNLITENKLELV